MGNQGCAHAGEKEGGGDLNECLDPPCELPSAERAARASATRVA